MTGGARPTWEIREESARFGVSPNTGLKRDARGSTPCWPADCASPDKSKSQASFASNDGLCCPALQCHLLCDIVAGCHRSRFRGSVCRVAGVGRCLLPRSRWAEASSPFSFESVPGVFPKGATGAPPAYKQRVDWHGLRCRARAFRLGDDGGNRRGRAAALSRGACGSNLS